MNGSERTKSRASALKEDSRRWAGEASGLRSTLAYSWYGGPKIPMDACFWVAQLQAHHPWTWPKLSSDLGLIISYTSSIHSKLKCFQGTLPNARPAMHIARHKHRSPCAPPSSYPLSISRVGTGSQLPSSALWTTWWVNTLPGFRADLKKLLSRWSTQQILTGTSEGQAEKWPCDFLLFSLACHSATETEKRSPSRTR